MYSGEWTNELLDILEAGRVKIADLTPSQWAELNRYMDSDITSVPGYFSFYNSPYTRELLDFFSQSHPGKIGAVKKGSQGGFSAGIIENFIAWMIANDPGNTMLMVGKEEHVKDSVSKVDRVLDSTNIRRLISNSSGRKNKVKTGDTDTRKEFRGGYLMIGLANHKLLRQISLRYGIVDDYEAMKGATEESGDTFAMVENRFKAFKHNMKLMFISTPELKKKSNIDKAYLAGDQRKFHIPAPCCGQQIVLEWETPSEINSEEKAGITWKIDESGHLIPESVGYICQKCGNFFNDEDKMIWLNKGEWIPTARPSRPGYYSWHWSALAAPTFMYGWLESVYAWLEAHPEGKLRDEEKYKTFINQTLGECYEPPTEKLSSTALQKNIRPYQIGVVPNKLSIQDGNGEIIILTCGIDMNGVEDDARLDYEVVAHSETGSTYSITHGSIGTFIPKDPGIIDREKWSYRFGADRCVWDELEKVLLQRFATDDGRDFGIAFSCLDSGYMTKKYAYTFVDSKETELNIVSVKGDPNAKYILDGADKRAFMASKEKPNLFLIETNLTKDRLASKMKSVWVPGVSRNQPPGFMNYPTPSEGKYLHVNYFAHFEAEHKVFDVKNEKFVWEKVSDNAQNHLFDCRLYNDIALEILVFKFMKENKMVGGKWSDFVKIVLGK